MKFTKEERREDTCAFKTLPKVAKRGEKTQFSQRSHIHTSHLDAQNLRLKNVQQGKSQRRMEEIEDTLCTQCIVKSHKEQEEESDCASHSSFVTKC
jgi:hypothetical protein